MTKFLKNISVESGGHIQFKTIDGTNAGKIDQDGNDLVLTNAVGDVLLGDGDSDIYIGNGSDNVDILFEQSGNIKADDSASGVTLTLGSSNTSLNIISPTIIGTTNSGAIISTGKITGTELEGTSLDINGNADIAGVTLLQASTGGNSATTLIPLDSGGNSQLKIKGGNYIHSVAFETSWNDFEYAKLTGGYNTGDSKLEINKSDASGAIDATTRISTGDSFFAGNVGIGTTAPGSKLEVNSGTTNVVGVFKSSDNQAWISVQDDDSGTYGALFGTDSDEGHDIVLADKSVNKRLVIDTSGNVGIGTTSPSQKLDVAGNISVYNSYAAGASLFLNHSDQYSSSIIKSIRDTIDQQDAGSSMLRFYTNDNSTTSPTVALDLTSESNAIFYGKVGIGTTSPTRSLHLNSSSNNYIRLQTTVVNGYAGVEFENDARTWTAGITNADAFVLSGGAQFSGGYPFMLEAAAPNASFIVKTSGNVGIGTTSPGAKLDVAAAVTTNVDIAHFSNSNGIAKAKISLSANSSGELYLIDGNNNTDVFISSNGDSYFNGGDVGIGTTSPSEKLHVDGNARVTGAYYDSGNTPGTANQVLASTATGTSWIDPGTITAEAATLVVIACKNTSGATITKGTPVYQTGTVGATSTIEIAPADALISANKLPAIGLLQTDLNDNGLGNVVITGELINFTTSPIDGVVPVTGDKVFVKSGGGLTLTKPTGEGNGIQNMGLVGKVAIGSAGSITVSSIMRANDVPNLPEGRIWVGDGNTIVSDTVYIDEPNNRLGIGTTNPQVELQVEYTDTHTSGDLNLANSAIDIYNNSSADVIGKGSTLTFSDNYLGTNKTTRAAIKGGTDTAGNTADGFLAFYTDSSGANSMQEHMRIDNDGEVLIGTTTPTGAKLIVNHDNTKMLELKRSGNTKARFIADSNHGQLDLYNSATVNTIRLLASGDSYLNGGNVGIGTTSPSAKLDVSYTGLAAKFVSTQATGLEVQGGANSQDIAKFKNTGGNVQFVVDANGNVGIGAASPSAKLEVVGNILANATNATVNIGSTISSTPTYGYPNTTAGTLIVGGYTNGGFSYQPGVMTLINQNPIIGAGTDLGVIQFAGKDDATSGYVSTMIKAFTAAAPGTGSSGGGIITISTTTNGYGSPIERFRINDSGNVGIGTTSPGAKLDVSGSIRTNSNLYVYNSDLSKQALRVNAEATTNTGIFKLSNGSNWGLLMRGESNSPYIGSYFNGNLSITGFEDSAGTSPSAIKLAQFVFGGTGGGSGYLTLNGDLKVNNNKKIKFGYANSQENGIEWVAGSKISAAITPIDTANFSRTGLGFFTGDFSDGTTNADERMRITRTGNVGIGTTSPSALFHIIDNTEQSQVRIGSDTSNYLSIDVAGDGDSTISAIGSGFLPPDINFNTNSTTVLKVSGVFGYVGIGTVTPSERLEVNGNVQAETLIATDLADGYVPYSQSGTLGLQDSSIYQDSGNVGIGTTTLSQTLNVDGEVLATGYRVSAMQTAPATRNSTGTLGEIRITSNYIYVCYATDSWSRVALATSW